MLCLARRGFTLHPDRREDDRMFCRRLQDSGVCADHAVDLCARGEPLDDGRAIVLVEALYCAVGVEDRCLLLDEQRTVELLFVRLMLYGIYRLAEQGATSSYI